MTVVNLTNEAKGIITGNDNIVIVNHFDGLRGGRTLDMTGFSGKIVQAGHLIIKTAEGVFKPRATNGGNYSALAEGEKHAGYLVATIPADKPFAAIMTRGTINPKAAPYPMDDALIEAVKKDLPLIDYQED